MTDDRRLAHAPYWGITEEGEPVIIGFPVNPIVNKSIWSHGHIDFINAVKDIHGIWRVIRQPKKAEESLRDKIYMFIIRSMMTIIYSIFIWYIIMTILAMIM